MSVVLSEHLPLLASAPDGIQKLRGLILELAVRGKLVPQDPNDEAASELLKRIAKERARLGADGKIKKSKPLPPVGEDEQPFALPVSWVWTRLGEITNFGQTDKDGEIRESTWVLDLEDIQKDTSVLLRKVRFSERQAKSDKNRFQDGDVLYGKLRPYLNKVIVADEEGVCTTEILPVRGYYGIFPRYLMHAVKRPDFLAYVNSKSYGMKMPRLGTDDGRSSLFPLPPLAEQQRIVAKVDELMILCDRLETEQKDAEAAHAKLVETLLGTLTQSTDATELAANWQRLAEHFDTLFTTESSLDTLKQTILQLAVRGKLVPQDPDDEGIDALLRRLPAQPVPARYEKRSTETIPGCSALSINKPEIPCPVGWAWVPLVKVAQLESGHTPSRNRPDWWGGDVPWIGIADARIHNNSTILNTLQTTNEGGLANSAARLLPSGTVCFSRTASVGYVVIMGRSMATSQDFVNWVPTEAITSPYLALVLRAEKPAMKRFSKGAVHQTIYYPEWLAMHISLPPLAEQHRIVAKVDELMALCDRLKADLAESRARQARLSATLIESALQAA